MATPSKKILVASALGVATLAFASGFVVSSANARPISAAPIVNVNAWNEEAPAMPVEIVNPHATQKCNPWDVSEVAMEEILIEMQRRGWRPPRQGDATEALASLGVEGIDAVDPYAPMPRRGGSYAGGPSSTIAVLSDEDAERVRSEEVSVEELLVDGGPAMTPS